MYRGHRPVLITKIWHNILSLSAFLSNYCGLILCDKRRFISIMGRELPDTSSAITDTFFPNVVHSKILLGTSFYVSGADGFTD